MFTSDNGFFAGEHRLKTGKNRVYEEAIRVPLLIRGPGIPAGVTVDDLGVNADLAPTILDAAGARPGRVEDGESLIPFAEHPARLHGRELLIEQFGQLRPTRRASPGGTFAAVRTSRYKYVEIRRPARSSSTTSRPTRTSSRTCTATRPSTRPRQPSPPAWRCCATARAGAAGRSRPCG